MLRSGTYGPVRVKVVEDNDQGDFIRYFCIDLGKTDRIPCVDFLRCGSLFKDTLEDVSIRFYSVVIVFYF